MSDLKPVRGTHDLLPNEMRAHRHVVDQSMKVANNFGFDEISTPIFESSNIFTKTLGDTSDVVTKEMYSFEDKGGDILTLRPENTAGVARAFISNGLQQLTPCKFFYAGPMFRYERPQKGRMRQFHQIGIELIGSPSPLADVEVIAAGHGILEKLGIIDKCTLELNSLGDIDSRRIYRTALVEYFNDHRDKLSDESQNRLKYNPLRILDSKSNDDKIIVENAPVFADYLNQKSLDFFDSVKSGIDQIGINYKLNQRLVRGLDYYCHTAFEFTTTHLGSQGAVIAGGRYDGLIEQMGGNHTPAVGWAGGIERLSMLVGQKEEKNRSVVFVPLGDNAAMKSLKIMNDLRKSDIRAEMAFNGNMKKRMKHANKINASFAIIIGDDELKKGVANVKNLDSGNQIEINLNNILPALKDIG